MSAKAVRGLLVYLLLGILFGVMLIKSEVISWFRIYEMFRFQSFRMYGILGSAVLTAAGSLQLMRYMNATTLDGEAIAMQPKTLGRGTRYWAGGLMFGLGWGMIGACPGPLFALIGGGVMVMLVPLVAALFGTAVYGLLRPELPH